MVENKIMGKLILLYLFLITAGILDSTFAQTGDENQPPTWVVESAKPLKDGVSEDTAIGTLLTVLNCTDPEGDPISYSLVSGQAISVIFNGSVYLAQELDFEVASSYDIAFACVDYDRFTFNDIHTQKVPFRTEMTVDDANDHDPVFKAVGREGYTYKISENAPNGTLLLPEIEITDKDITINALIENIFLLCEDPSIQQPETSLETCSKFALRTRDVREGLYEAEIYLKGTLDFESRPVYSTKMVAIDSGLPKRRSATSNIQINILDAQDRDPIFTNLGSTTAVSEGELQGAILDFAISARDGDTGDNRPVRLSIITDDRNAFTLGPSEQTSTGEYAARLIIDNPLDRETIEGAYEFVVKVTELDATTLQETTATATATYSVTVTDINDEIPEFEQSLYTVNVTEMAFSLESVQITGLRIVCLDRDEPSNARYTVRIIDQTFPNVFSLSPDTVHVGSASIFLSADNTTAVDYDVPVFRRQVLVLEARELINIGSSSTTVIINLVDTNDNSPQFTLDVYNVRISENQPIIPTTIATLQANDFDSGSNGQVTYNMQQGNQGARNLFLLDPISGDLILQRPVNYEDTNQYVFLVYATDQGREARSSQAQVTITILNFNDLKPVFQQTEYQTTVNEGTLNFLTPVVVRATDNEDDTVRVTYRIVSGQTPDNAFVMNADTGRLTLINPLLYEDTIKDQNNQPTGSFELVIEASDNGNPPQTSTVPVSVSLIDQNNYGPVLTPAIYTSNISESAAPGTVVARITGSDQDLGDFGKITYRLDSGHFDNFAVDSDRGIVVVNDPQNFDYDQDKSYEVKIKATDGGSPQRSATATIYVEIYDSNNKPPRFIESIYTRTVNEDEDRFFTILTVFAQDDDSSKNLRYRILTDTIRARDGDGNLLTSIAEYDYINAIGINEETGDVFVNSQLDKETALEINFQVEVEDIAAETPNQRDTTQVSLTVTGRINDQLIFDVISQNFVNEGTDTDFEVVTLVATDPLHPRENLDFYKTDGSDYFDVDLRGIVKLTGPIDFETDPIIHRLVVTAVAADGLRSATATVTINILDVNDNAPEFDRQSYYAEVDEDARYPTVAISIRATDRDSSSYGPIVYQIGGGISSSDFQLFESGGGVLVLVAQGATLNFNRQSFYELDIVAIDNPNRDVAGNQNFQRVKLEIQVKDTNNNYPTFKFEETFRSMAVAETAPIEKSVGTVIATDDDFGQNGEISYFLQAITDEPDSFQGIQLFRIIEELGTVVVDSSLIGLGGKRYPMRVRATDHGEPSNSAYLRIEIEVLSTEIDDGNPLWVTPSEDYPINVEEEKVDDSIIPPNFFVVVPRTGDTITFSLSPLTTYNDAFVIDSTTGQIGITRPLDREMRESYILIVYAEDTQDPEAFRSAQQIIVNLVDRNDNDASFQNPQNYPQCGEPIVGVVTINVEENIPANVTVYEVSACDPDATGNNEIMYRPYTGNNYCNQNYAASDLMIEPDGRITTKKVIDFETSHEFILCVEALSVVPVNNRKKRAFDESQVDFNIHNVLYLHVMVRDENDNSPRFPEDVIIAAMSARPSILETVVWLDAVDSDGDAFNTIVYSISSVTYYENDRSWRVDDLFIVKSQSAISPSRTNYEGYLNGHFEMEVLATDSLNAQFQDTQTIRIFVYRSRQAIKVILNHPPSEGYAKAQPMINELNAVDSRYVFKFLQASEHQNEDVVDVTKTDVCILGTDTVVGSAMDIRSVIRVLDGAAYEDILFEAEYNVIDRGACYPSKSSDETVEWRDLWWVLVAIAIFLFVCCLIFIMLICILYKRYKQYMKSKEMYLVQE